MCHVIYVISCGTFHVSGVMCLVRCVTFHISLVTCHLSPVANTNSHIHPFPVNSPIMHSRLVFKGPKNKTHLKTQKKTHWNNKSPKIIEVCQYRQNTLWPEVSSPLGSGFFRDAHTHRQTSRRLMDIPAKKDKKSKQVLFMDFWYFYWKYANVPNSRFKTNIFKPIFH